MKKEKNYIQKVITVASWNSKDGRHSIRDHEGEWYSFFDKEYQKPTETEALRTFRDLGIKDNSTCKVTYYETPNGDQVYKNITIFEKASDKESEDIPPFVEAKDVPDKFEEARKQNSDGQSWGNAKTNAVTIYRVLVKLHPEMEDEIARRKFIIDEANWLHNLEPMEQPTAEDKKVMQEDVHGEDPDDPLPF